MKLILTLESKLMKNNIIFHFFLLGPGASESVNMKPKFFNGDLGVFYLTNARKSGFEGKLSAVCLQYGISNLCIFRST